MTKQPERVKEAEQAAQSAVLWVGAMALVQRMILVPGHDCLDLALPQCSLPALWVSVDTQEVWPEALATT